MYIWFQFTSLVCPTLRPHELPHTRPPCPSPTPGVYIQTHVNRVSDAIQLPHPLSSPSPPALNLSQHQEIDLQCCITFCRHVSALDQLLYTFVPSGAISSLFSSSILDTYSSGEFTFQCHIFLPFHAVHGSLKARMPKWFAIRFSSGPLSYWTAL